MFLLFHRVLKLCSIEEKKNGTYESMDQNAPKIGGVSSGVLVSLNKMQQFICGNPIIANRS